MFYIVWEKEVFSSCRSSDGVRYEEDISEEIDWYPLWCWLSQWEIRTEGCRGGTDLLYRRIFPFAHGLTRASEAYLKDSCRE